MDLTLTSLYHTVKSLFTKEHQKDELLIYVVSILFYELDLTLQRIIVDNKLLLFFRGLDK